MTEETKPVKTYLVDANNYGRKPVEADEFEVGEDFLLVFYQEGATVAVFHPGFWASFAVAEPKEQ